MPIRSSVWRKTIAALLTAGATALGTACAVDGVSQPQRTLKHPSVSHIITPCDPTQQQCDGGGSPGGTPDTTLIPLCSAAGGAHAASTTTASDSSIAVQVDGPLYVRNCRGPAVWQASTTGAVAGAHYRWYVSQCKGLYNYCGGTFGLAQEGDNLTTMSVTLTPDVRTYWVYVEAKDLGGRYLSGVSNKMFTKGPAFGPDGGMTFGQPCFVADYPFAVEVMGTILVELPETTIKFISPQYYYYSRNYCNGNREWDPQTGSPTKPAG